MSLKMKILRLISGFVFFCRKRCDINADSMSSLDMLTESEKSHVHTFFGKCIKKLTDSDQQLPQVNKKKHKISILT
jgi:antiviral helicase SKI2